MKIHCPNFVSKVVVFTKVLSRFVPNSCLFLLFKAILRLRFSVEILLFQPKSPSKKSTFVFNFWLFHRKKVKNSNACKKMRNWWNFIGIKENSVSLSGILMG